MSWPYVLLELAIKGRLPIARLELTVGLEVPKPTRYISSKRYFGSASNN